MKDDLNKIALIEQYLKGNLTGKTLEEFEQELSNDPALAAEVQVQQALYTGIDRLGDKELQQELDTYFDEYERNADGFGKGKRKMFFYALGGLLLVIMSIYIFTQYNEDNTIAHANDTVIDSESASEQQTSLEGTNTTDADTITTADTTRLPNSANDSSNIVVTKQKAQEQIVEITKFTNPIVLAHTRNKLEYIFTMGELRLFGADHFSLQRLEIIRHRNQLLLFDQKTYYPLEEGYKRRALKADPNVRIFETFRTPSPSSPKITIKKEFIERKEETEFTSIRVISKKGLTGKKYRYNGVNIEMTEELFDYFGKNFSMLYINELKQYVFETKEGLFYLEKDTDNFVDIIKMNDSNVTKLFETDQISVPLKHETIEGGYGDGHHPTY